MRQHGGPGKVRYRGAESSLVDSVAGWSNQVKTGFPSPQLNYVLSPHGLSFLTLSTVHHMKRIRKLIKIFLIMKFAKYAFKILFFVNSCVI